MTIPSWVLVQRGKINTVLVNNGWHVLWMPTEEREGKKYLLFRARLLRNKPITAEAVTGALIRAGDSYGFDPEISEAITNEHRMKKKGAMLTGKEMVLAFEEQTREENDIRVFQRNRYGEGI